MDGQMHLVGVLGMVWGYCIGKYGDKPNQDNEIETKNAPEVFFKLLERYLF